MNVGYGWELDELLMLLSTVVLLLAIFFTARLQGGLIKIVQEFVGTAENGGMMLMLLLSIPVSLLAVYFFLLFFPWFRADDELRETIVRPSIFTINIILAVYILNGRLVRAIRGVARWGYHLWTKSGIFRT